MDNDIKELLEKLNLPLSDNFIISPTSFYLKDGSWLISPENNGIRVSTTTGTHSVPDLYIYALLMRVLNNPVHIRASMSEIIETLISRVAHCAMNSHTLMFDDDGIHIEVYAKLVQRMVGSGEDSSTGRSSKEVWRINTQTNKLYRQTPNQWMLETSTWDVEDYYNDIRGYMLLLDTLTK